MVTPHQQQLKHLLQLTKMRMLITKLSEESMFPASETIDEKSSARAWTSVLIARPLRPKNEKRKKHHIHFHVQGLIVDANRAF